MQPKNKFKKKYKKKKKISGFLRLRGIGVGGGWWLKVMEFLFRIIKNVPQLIVAMVAQLCNYAKSHWIVLFKWMNCMECELYLIKAAKNVYTKTLLFKCLELVCCQELPRFYKVLESISRLCSWDLPIGIHPISSSSGHVRLNTGCIVLGGKTPRPQKKGGTRPLLLPWGTSLPSPPLPVQGRDESSLG